jgi:hypothetical protein
MPEHSAKHPPAESHSPPNPPSKKLSKRQARVLIVFGALTVLATFIVKDVLEERYKDISSSTLAAQTFFTISYELSDIARRENDTESRLQVINERIRHLNGQHPKYNIDDIMDDPHLVDYVGNADFKREVDHLAVLLKALNDPNNSKLTRLQDASSDLDEQAHDQLEVLHYTQIEPNQRQAEEWQKSLKFITGKIRAEQATFGSGDFGLDTFVKEVLKEADRRKEQSENSFNQFRYASYVLYPLGWLLALTGRLFGEEDVSGGD